MHERPFNFGTSVPTNEEVTYVAEDIREDCLKDLKYNSDGEPIRGSDVDEQLSRLLGDFSVSSAASTGDNPQTFSELHWLDDVASKYTGHLDDNEEFILTAAERRRLYGLPISFAGDSGDVTADRNSEDRLSPVDDRPVKRLRFSSPAEVISITPAPSFEDDPSLVFPAFSGDALDSSDYLDNVEDSGVYIPELSALTAKRTKFEQLSASAYGFDGPMSDGEVVPDVESVFLDEWEPDYQWQRASPSDKDSLSPEGVVALENGFMALQYLRFPEDDNAEWNRTETRKGNSPTLGHRDDIPRQYTARLVGNTSLNPQHGDNLTEYTIQDGMLDIVPSEDAESTTLPTNTKILPSAVALSHHAELPLSIEPTLTGLQNHSAKQSLQEFMGLRSRNARPYSANPTCHPIALAEPLADPSVPAIRVPPDLASRYTLTVSATRPSAPQLTHRYLVSLSFIQRRGLIRALDSPQCAVQVVERECLGGADIVLNPHTAIVLSCLRALPTQSNALISVVNQLSWRFSFLLILFDSFPSGPCSRTQEDWTTEQLTLDPFSPPVVKALKKLRRDIGIAEGCIDKCAEATVQFAFPLTVMDAARTVRLFGDMAHERDLKTTAGALWDDRRWLDLDYEDSVSACTMSSLHIGPLYAFNLNLIAPVLTLCRTSAIWPQ